MQPLLDGREYRAPIRKPSTARQDIDNQESNSMIGLGSGVGGTDTRAKTGT